VTRPRTRRVLTIVAAVALLAGIIVAAQSMIKRGGTSTPPIAVAAPSASSTLSGPPAPVTRPPKPVGVRPTSTPAPAPAPPTTKPAPPPVDGRASAQVTTTFAAWNDQTRAVEAGGYVSTVENPGECTLKVSQGSTVRTVSRTGTADASTVSCGGLAIPGSDLSAGAWQATLTYSSAARFGAATPVTVQVSK
jgi:hypothetical protein